MGISGCTSRLQGGVEALKAYDPAFQLRLNENQRTTQNMTSIAAGNQAGANQSLYENRPIAGTVAGGNINISA